MDGHYLSIILGEAKEKCPEPPAFRAKRGGFFSVSGIDLLNKKSVAQPNSTSSISGNSFSRNMANKVTVATYRQKIAIISVMIINILNMIHHQLFTSHLKKISYAQLWCCKPLQNTNILLCLLFFFIGAPIVLERNLHF